MASYNKQIVGKYELGKVLASGYFDSRTRLCTHIVTGAQYVMRIFNKNVLAEAKWMWERMRDSIHVMRSLPKHENIIETVECFETQTSLYILMQLFSPTHLTKLYTNETSSGQRVLIPMQKTKKYITQVVHGLTHMHKHNVVHLGLAPDHVMVNDRDQVKIGYLISCMYFPKGKLCREIRGTTHTVAPEVLRNEPYDPYLADAWSMGILIYFLLHQGRYPHDGANTTKNIMYSRIRPPDDSLPPEAKDLLTRLLHPKPSCRMRVEDILSHRFFAVDQSDANNVERRTSGRLVASTAETYYSLDFATGEDTVDIRIPYGLSRQDEAAYIIQHTFRAYHARKRRQLSQGKIPMSSKVGGLRHRKHSFQAPKILTSRASGVFGGPDDVSDSLAPLVDKKQTGAGTQSGTSELPLLESTGAGSTTTRAAHEEDSSDIILIESPVANRTSVMLPPPPDNGIRTTSLLFPSRGNSIVFGELGSSRKKLNSVSSGRTRMASFVPGLQEERRLDERSISATSGLLPNIKIDLTRPCPLCHRLPMKRVGACAPYATTPFVYKDGEFYDKVDED